MEDKMEYKNEIMNFARNSFNLKHKIDERVGKEFNLAPIEVEILSLVYLRGEQVTASFIEKERCIKKNTISIHVDNLVELGLLERREGKDRRTFNLLLTDKAQNIAKRCIKENEALKHKLMKGLTEEEIEVMHKILHLLNENARELLKN